MPPLTLIFLLNRLKPRYACTRTQAGRSEFTHACCPYLLPVARPGIRKTDLWDHRICGVPP
jgi:hypothetical protein